MYYLVLVGFVSELVERSRLGLHDMFIRTYGRVYQQNADLFADLFADFRSYLIDGIRLDVTDSLDQFFVDLMRRMFILLNVDDDVIGPSSPTTTSGFNNATQLSDEFVACMTGHIDRLAPFGDVPDKLATQVGRAFVSTRAFIVGLSTGRDVINTVIKEVACCFVLVVKFIT